MFVYTFVGLCLCVLVCGICMCVFVHVFVSVVVCRGDGVYIRRCMYVCVCLCTYVNVCFFSYVCLSEREREREY